MGSWYNSSPNDSPIAGARSPLLRTWSVPLNLHDAPGPGLFDNVRNLINSAQNSFYGPMSDSGLDPLEALHRQETTTKRLLLPLLLVMAAALPTLCCLSIVGLAASVILLISLLLVRILQLFRCDGHYAKLARIKHSIRFGLFICALLILIGVAFFFPLFNYVPLLKQITILRLPLAKWTVLLSIMSGLYILTTFLYYIVHEVIAYFMPSISLNARQAFSEIIDCLFCLWASYVVMDQFPSATYHKLLGFTTRKWINVSILVDIGCNLTILLTRFTVLMLRNICHRDVNVKSTWQTCLEKYLYVKDVVYYAEGMLVSINFVISSLLLLLAWTMYIGLHLDMMRWSPTWKLGLWTLVSLNICSFLWLIKSFVLLTWEAHTIYHRLRPRILSARKKLYFLWILDSIKCDDDDEGGDVEEGTDDQRHRWKVVCMYLLSNIGISFLDIMKEKRDATTRLLRDILLLDLVHPNHTKGINTDAIQEMSQHFIQAKKYLSRETYLSDIQRHFLPRNRGGSSRLTLNAELLRIEKQDFIKKEVGETRDDSLRDDEYRRNCLTNFLTVLHHRGDLKQFGMRYHKVRPWVERAHHQCVNLANTIDSAKELANCLNEIISWLLIGAIFIMWLLLTGLASTQLFVLIASPLLAATFIFGDTCKTLFQGIIYVFVVHPFDVGDLCVIEGKMMEVRSITIWTTTFVKVDKYGSAKELVIYSNSKLTSKTVINHKTKFDWSDCAEFNLVPSRMTELDMKDEIITFLKDRLLPPDDEDEDDDNFPYKFRLRIDKDGNSKQVKERCKLLANTPNLSITTKEEKVTLVVRLEFKAGNTKDWTYTECLMRKDSLKGDFRLYVLNIIREFKATQANAKKQTCHNS